jgi:hypothetical protein
MLKIILLTSVVSVSCFSAGRVHYSGLQIQQPLGTAFKMTPDPSNIWSFHETYKITQTGSHSVKVLVDFDNNGKMDTEYKDVRVMITDISIDRAGNRFLGNAPLLYDLFLVDDKGKRWSPTLIGSFADHVGVVHYCDALRTPLVLPVDSGLRVEFYAKRLGGVQDDVHIQLIGRLVTL